MEKKQKQIGKFEKVLNTIGVIIISIIILTFNLIIGANEKGLRILPISIFLTIIIIYLIIKKIVSKENIVIKNKIDIFVLLFMLSTILPLIFKTYCTYQGTMEFILKYFFVYAFYLLVRNAVDSKRKVGVLVSITILASLIPMILGIYIIQAESLREKMPDLSSALDTMLQKLNLKYSSDYRFSSTFGYANALSMYAVFCVFLAVNKLENNKSKILKILDLIYVVFASYIIYVSYSRAVLTLYIISIILYLVIKLRQILKDKITIKKKHLIIIEVIILIVIGIIVFLFINVGLKYSEAYECNSKTTSTRIRYNFKPDTDYEITLDMSCEDDNIKTVDSLKVELIEYNEYLNTNVLATVNVDDLSQTVKLNFKTSEDKILYIKLKVKKTGTETVNINKCYINGKEYILKYKYIPKVISRLILSATTREKSLVQRGQIYLDCLKIAKGHLLIGQGGNTWKKLNTAVEDYLYVVKETHSYFFELLISYGIIGVGTFIILIGYTLVKLIKELKKNQESRKEKLLITIGLFLLIIYSFVFDFNMSFLVILLTTFEYIALLNYNLNDENKYNDLKCVEYLILIFLIFILSIYITADIAEYCTDNYKTKVELSSYNASYNFEYIKRQKITNKEYFYDLVEFMKKEPYYEQLSIYEVYWDTLFKKANTFTDEEFEKYVTFGIETFKERLPEKRMDSSQIIKRAQLMEKIINNLNTNSNSKNTNIIQNAITEIKEIMKNEYDENIINLKAQNRNKMNSSKIKQVVEEYEEIMKLIQTT